MLPSGFLNKNAKVMIGPGVVVNPDVLLKEIQDFDASGRSFVDKYCGIIEEKHLTSDSKGELKEKIGSTGSGTGPANADRAMRVLKNGKGCRFTFFINCRCTFRGKFCTCFK